MSIQSFFAEVDQQFNDFGFCKGNRNAFVVMFSRLASLASNQKLVREQFAASEYLKYKADEFNKSLSLAYICGGHIFSTAKHYSKQNVNSTEILHSLINHLNSDVWDAMGKCSLYPDGTVYQWDKKENVEITSKYVNRFNGIELV